MTYIKPNKNGKQNQTDKVMTREYIAIKIINHFKSQGIVLDPAKGTGNFYNNFKGKKDWCEIDEGKDFFNYNKKVDWIITNPPYSIYDMFLLKCFEVSDNVVLLVPLTKAFKSQKIQRQIEKYGGLKEVVMLGGGQNIGFNFGFPVGCLYYKRNYKGKCKITNLTKQNHIWKQYKSRCSYSNMFRMSKSEKHNK